MSKELKSLERIENYQVVIDIEKDKTATIKELLPSSCETLETALKDYELLKQTKIIVADKKISDEDLEKLKNQRMFVGGLEQCEIKPLFDEITQKKHKALEIIKKCCEFDFIKEEENDKPIRYEIHIRRKGGDNIFFPCLAIYPKTHEEYDLLKEVLK